MIGRKSFGESRNPVITPPDLIKRLQLVVGFTVALKNSDEAAIPSVPRDANEAGRDLVAERIGWLLGSLTPEMADRPTEEKRLGNMVVDAALQFGDKASQGTPPIEPGVYQNIHGFTVGERMLVVGAALTPEDHNTVALIARWSDIDLSQCPAD